MKNCQRKVLSIHLLLFFVNNLNYAYAFVVLFCSTLDGINANSRVFYYALLQSNEKSGLLSIRTQILSLFYFQIIAVN